ncbi:hypothetical protein KKC06_06220 [Patescibacteria group bacterium]|nr:hypothetical protein [Patescibacteria group bacterium]
MLPVIVFLTFGSGVVIIGLLLIRKADQLEEKLRQAFSLRPYFNTNDVALAMRLFHRAVDRQITIADKSPRDLINDQATYWDVWVNTKPLPLWIRVGGCLLFFGGLVVLIFLAIMPVINLRAG